MPIRSGRIEKRIQQAIPVEIATLQQSAWIERASTENVSSLGARVLSERPRQRNEIVAIRSLFSEHPAEARIVYCERLADGRFGIGMHFLREVANWSNGLSGGNALR